MAKLRLSLALSLALALAACGKSPAALAADDPAFGEKVKAYLMAHPEIIEEAIGKLQENKQTAAAQALVGKLNAHRAAIDRDPRDFVVNPGGKITVVEFFDYRCGYCKLAAPEITKLVQQNPDIRFVFKEFVIFGPESEAAARAAIGAGRQGKYFDTYQRFMAEKALDRAAVPRLLKAGGIDVAKAQATGAEADVTKHLKDVHDLAITLGIEGTPAFIVGDVMVPGADMEALNAAIQRARGKAA